jgi:endonuclease/exonuclease/phosphatase family metal-dependent hydrolase
MKNRNVTLFWVLALAVFVLSCAGGSGFGKDRNAFSLASWNTQTFFDGETSGDEYNEFKGASSSWSRDKYRDRLKRLCESIKILDADVLALEEIENEAVLFDIANELSGVIAPHKLYGYACFARQPGSSIGCAVLSRFPLEGLTVHNCDYRASLDKKPPLMRPLLEVSVRVSAAAPPIKLFVAHWKSKSGDTEDAAFWQSRQESVLARRISRFLEQTDGNGAVIACGDFNRGADEFEALSALCESGWSLFPESIVGKGSYYYREQWERIDHIFVAGAASLKAFAAQTSGPWTRPGGSESIPYRYAVRSGKGYSDHLPVTGVVSLRL